MECTNGEGLEDGVDLKALDGVVLAVVTEDDQLLHSNGCIHMR